MKKKEIFRVGDRVFDIVFQEWGVVTSTDYDEIYPVEISFDGGNRREYTADGFLFAHDKQPRLSFTECSVFDGKFSQERPLPLIEKDTLIYVRYKDDEWYMRYFSHFVNGKAVCFGYQMKSTETSRTNMWEEYSITNPLLFD